VDKMGVPPVFGTLHVPPISPTTLTASFTAMSWQSLLKNTRVTTFVARPGSDSPMDLPSRTMTGTTALCTEDDQTAISGKNRGGA